MSDDVLYAIAARAGVQRGFRNAHGEHVESPTRAIAAVLEALGYNVSSDESRDQTLAALQAAERRPIAATTVVLADAPIQIRS